MKSTQEAIARESSVGELPARSSPPERRIARAVRIPMNGISVAGDLVVPADAPGLVLFAPGSIGRESPRNIVVARQLEAARLGTLLFDLLTPMEGFKDAGSGYWHFDIDLLAHRLIQVTQWLTRQDFMAGRALGYFGSGTGAAAALIAAARLGPKVGAVVSRGGRVDLAGEYLSRVTTPTLFVVGEDDLRILERNQNAFKRLRCEKQLSVIPGATHFFEERGTLEDVASLTTAWFLDHLKSPVPK